MVTPPLQNAFQHGDLEIKGQFTLGSNYTFLVEVAYEDQTYPAVYKPTRGEQPLWDFEESTLALREVAAYLVSEALGFHIVPFTTLREEGPYGAGSLQQFIEHDPNYHYFNFSPEDKLLLKPVAIFDLLVNNADRKGGHVFFENDTRKLYAIDHGICFHEEDKLRTVLWDFGGQKIPDDLLARLSPSSSLLADLEPYLSPDEILALQSRAESIRKRGVFPRQPRDRRAIPWPPL
ncbi:MAG: phosphatidylinositol kinase [Anaerolineales bacterium]|nr:SCO1664 family protein [Anaerolineae bacterium]PWB72791.1 MAG: phosphatidylinositol kinase [Anaerolineales bacterium]